MAQNYQDWILLECSAKKRGEQKNYYGSRRENLSPLKRILYRLFYPRFLSSIVWRVHLAETYLRAKVISWVHSSLRGVRLDFMLRRWKRLASTV